MPMSGLPLCGKRMVCRVLYSLQKRWYSNVGCNLNEVIFMKVRVPVKEEVEVPIQRITADDIAARLKTYEQRYGMTTEEFDEKFTKGEVEETREFVEWHLEYRFYLDISRKPAYELRS
jgi:hypothetical protein